MTTIPNITELKAQAKRLRADTAGMSHAAALETVAHLHGVRDWNTAQALAKQTGLALSVGGRVQGQYLGHDFQGQLLALAVQPGRKYRVTVKFDTPVDVVAFDSFSSFRRRVTSVIDEKGVSPQRISDGTPHMVLTAAP